MEITELDFTGTLTYEILTNRLQQAFDSPDCNRHRWLLRFYNCDNQLMAADIEKLTHLLVGQIKAIQAIDVKIVILVDNELDLGLMHMLSAYCALAGLEIMVTNGDRSDALAKLVA